MKSKLFLIMFSLLLLTVIVNADESGGTLIGKQNQCVDLLQECASCSYSTITSIQYPNMSRDYINAVMTKQGTSYNYSFCETSDLGNYVYCGASDVDGTDTSWCKDFQITENGNPSPDGVVIVLFSIAMLLVMGFMVYELILSIGHFASLDLDVVDLSKCMGVYFALLVLYQLELSYLGNAQIENWLLLFIGVGGFTHLIVPIIGFVISITVGSLSKKQVDFGTKRILRRQKLGKI